MTITDSYRITHGENVDSKPGEAVNVTYSSNSGYYIVTPSSGVNMEICVNEGAMEALISAYQQVKDKVKQKEEGDA